MTRCRSNSNTITSHIAEKFKMVIKFDSFKEKKKTNTLCSWNLTQTCDSTCCSLCISYTMTVPIDAASRALVHKMVPRCVVSSCFS